MASTLLKKIKFGGGGWDNIEIHCGTTAPESNIYAPYGSIYIYTGSAISTIYQKRSDVSLSTGWFNISGNASTTVKGIVNQSAAIADITTPDATDEATAIALANANKAKINEMLAKLRTAGILAT